MLCHNYCFFYHVVSACLVTSKNILTTFFNESCFIYFLKNNKFRKFVSNFKNIFFYYLLFMWASVEKKVPVLLVKTSFLSFLFSRLPFLSSRTVKEAAFCFTHCRKLCNSKHFAWTPGKQIHIPSPFCSAPNHPCSLKSRTRRVANSQ